MTLIYIFSIFISYINGQTSSEPSQTYFIDIYRFKDISISNTPPDLGQDRISNPSGYPYIAFPIATCTRNGDDVNAGEQYIIWSCDENSNVWRCGQGGASSCPNSICNQNDFMEGNADGFSISNQQSTEFGGGICDSTNPVSSKTVNYMEIDFYTAYTEIEDGCPGINKSMDTYGYELVATDKFATNICVEQDNGKYIMVECDLNGGYINQYTDSSCNNLDDNLLTYTTRCSYFDNPTGELNQDRYFRRYGGCYVNDVNMIQPTINPTTNPSISPSISPSKNPTKSPIVAPTVSPTTAIPSESPSKIPTDSPTWPRPTEDPTLKPTKSPVTRRPSRSPIDYTQSPTPSPTPSPTDTDDFEELKDKAQNLTYMEIGIIIGAVLCVVIVCCLFCICQRKKAKNLRNTHGMTMQQRKLHLRQKNMQRRTELQQKKQIQQQHIIRQMSPSSHGLEGPSQEFTVI